MQRHCCHSSSRRSGRIAVALLAAACAGGCHLVYDFEGDDRDALDTGADDGDGAGDVHPEADADDDVGDDAGREAGDDGDGGTCGDGRPDPSEDCDDGNDVPGDGCESDCTWSCTRSVECDDGLACNGAETCTAHRCVDGTPSPDGTPCSTASVTDGACRGGVCAPTTCGNGEVDDGEECDDDPPETCTTSCGSAGSRTCTIGCTWSACAAPAEVCNGADDDCDTACDDGFSCCAGSRASCTTSCDTAGSRTCTSLCTWGFCEPPTEVCNGLDDDCDTACDNGFACCAGTSGPCETSCRSTGSRACGAGCAWSSCAVPAEACNGLDDDCDTACDNGFACCAGRSDSCTTACGTSGFRTCSAACTSGTCCAPAEVCGNSCDDDCDTLVDNGCSTCPPCTGAVNISAGGRFTGAVGTGASLYAGSCGGAGAEALFTFTLAETRDVFLSAQGSAFDTVLYVRRCQCMGMEVACNDDANGTTRSTLLLPSLGAGSYQVFLEAKAAGSGGSYQLDAYITEPGLEGDRCGNPIFLTAAGDTRDSCLFSADYVPERLAPCSYAGSGAAEDVVYYFVLPAAATVRFGTCDSSSFCPDGGCVDTEVYVRNICGSGSSERACAEDGCGYRVTGIRIHSDTGALALEAGLYYVFVDGYRTPTTTEMYCGNYALTATGL